MIARQGIMFVIALALAAAVERLLLGTSSHGTSWWAHVPGFFALFGFLGCIGLVFLAKALGKFWLQRSERYYESGAPDDD